MADATISILFFAAAADAFGSSRLDLAVSESARVESVLEQLAIEFPRAGELLGSVAVAVNEQYAPRSTLLRPGDVIAIIPPVSGG